MTTATHWSTLRELVDLRMADLQSEAANERLIDAALRASSQRSPVQRRAGRFWPWSLLMRAAVVDQMPSAVRQA